MVSVVGVMTTDIVGDLCKDNENLITSWCKLYYFSCLHYRLGYQFTQALTDNGVQCSEIVTSFLGLHTVQFLVCSMGSNQSGKPWERG